MSDTATDERLRRLEIDTPPRVGTDFEKTLPILDPLIDPNSPRGLKAAAENRRLRAARQLAHAENERLRKEREAAEEAERQRRATNAPLIAELDLEIAELGLVRDAEHQRAVAPIDRKLSALRAQRDALR